MTNDFERQKIGMPVEMRKAKRLNRETAVYAYKTIPECGWGDMHWQDDNILFVNVMKPGFPLKTFCDKEVVMIWLKQLKNERD